jgi:hypothetical protein
MATVQDPKSGKFKAGHKPLGRPTGSKNKLKITDVLLDADKHSTDALEFLIQVMNGNVKGASTTQRQSAAIKIIDLAYKNKTDSEKTDSTDNAIADLTHDDTPKISLTAI